MRAPLRGIRWLLGPDPTTLEQALTSQPGPVRGTKARTWRATNFESLGVLARRSQKSWKAASRVWAGTTAATAPALRRGAAAAAGFLWMGARGVL